LYQAAYRTNAQASKYLKNLSPLLKIITIIKYIGLAYLFFGNIFTGILTKGFLILLGGSSFIASVLSGRFNRNLDKTDARELRYQGMNLMNFWIFMNLAGVIVYSKEYGEIFLTGFFGLAAMYLVFAVIIISAFTELDEDHYRMNLSYTIIFPSSLLLYNVMPYVIFLFIPPNSCNIFVEEICLDSLL